MVRRRARTLSDLRAIDGVGQARCERYGEVFLGLLSSLQLGPDDARKDGPDPEATP
jgi:hypothetical protein